MYSHEPAAVTCSVHWTITRLMYDEKIRMKHWNVYIAALSAFVPWLLLPDGRPEGKGQGGQKA